MNPTSTADQYYQQLSDKENQYYNDLMSQYGNNHTLVLNHLDAAHKLAVGNDDHAQAQFLENIANKAEADQGRNQFDYNTNIGRENTGYGLATTANSQNYQNALAKLNNDDFTNRQQLQQQEGTANQSTSEDLNSRGLLYGQKPGGTNPNQVNNTANPSYQPLTGLTGVAGKNADTLNTPYNEGFGALGRNLNLNTQDQTNQYTQSRNLLDFNHTNNLQDITTTARRNAQDESNTYGYNTGVENNQYNQNMAALQRAKAKALQTDKQASYTLGGRSAGVLGY